MRTRAAVALVGVGLAVLTACGEPEKPKDSDVTDREAELFANALPRVLPKAVSYDADTSKQIVDQICDGFDSDFTYGQVSSVTATTTGISKSGATVDRIINLAFRTACPSMAKKAGVTIQ